MEFLRNQIENCCLKRQFQINFEVIFYLFFNNIIYIFKLKWSLWKTRERVLKNPLRLGPIINWRDVNGRGHSLMTDEKFHEDGPELLEDGSEEWIHLSSCWELHFLLAWWYNHGWCSLSLSHSPPSLSCSHTSSAYIIDKSFWLAFQSVLFSTNITICIFLLIFVRW